MPFYMFLWKTGIRLESLRARYGVLTFQELSVVRIHISYLEFLAFYCISLYLLNNTYHRSIQTEKSLKKRFTFI